MKPLNNYFKACEELKVKFLKELYPEAPEFYADEFWVGDDIGETLSWGDYFVNMDDMVGYFKYEYTPDEWFDFYDQWVEKGDKSMNMKHFKIKKNKKL